MSELSYSIRQVAVSLMGERNCSSYTVHQLHQRAVWITKLLRARTAPGLVSEVLLIVVGLIDVQVATDAPVTLAAVQTALQV